MDNETCETVSFSKAPYWHKQMCSASNLVACVGRSLSPGHVKLWSQVNIIMMGSKINVLNVLTYTV